MYWHKPITALISREKRTVDYGRITIYHGAIINIKNQIFQLYIIYMHDQGITLKPLCGT